jgi:hypothetical protein
VTSTNPRPSEKFIEAISPYFISKGYSFRKSPKQFILDFEHGKQIVYLPFLNLTGGTEVQLQFGLDFPLLEKIYGTLKGWAKKVDSGYSFGTELNNLPEVRLSEQLYYFPLYDTQTFKVDEISVNNMTTHFIAAFEKYAEPFFERYRDLSEVEKQLNKLPVSYPVITNFTDKHIVFGLLLAAVYSKDNYTTILDAYKEYINTTLNAADLHKLILDTDQLIKTSDMKTSLAI